MEVFTLSRAKSHDKYWEQLQDSIREAFGIEPNNVHGQYNATTGYYTEYLFRIVKSIFDVKCPKSWDKDYILTNLCLVGYIGITDTPIGVLPLKCSATGVNVFELPTELLFANPVLGSFSRIIDENAVVVHLNGMIRRNGIFPIVTSYAQKLANCDASIDINLFNSRTTEIYKAADKKEADSIQKMYDEMQQGKPAVFINSTIMDNVSQCYNRKVKENFVADTIQHTKRLIVEEFLTMIGVNNANTDKRERLNEAEVNSNNEELMVNTGYWASNLRDSCKRAREMFNIDFDITMPYRNYQNPITTSSLSELERGDSNAD